MKRISNRISRRAGADVANNANQGVGMGAVGDELITGLSVFGRITAFISMIVGIIFGGILIFTGIFVIRIKNDDNTVPVSTTTTNANTGTTTTTTNTTASSNVKLAFGIGFIIFGVIVILFSVGWFYFSMINKTTGAIAGMVDGVSMIENM